MLRLTIPLLLLLLTPKIFSQEKDEIKEILSKATPEAKVRFLRERIDKTSVENPQEALYLAKLLLSESTNQKKELIVAESHSTLTQLYGNIGDLTNSIHHGREGARIYNELGKNREEAELLFELGTSLVFKGEHQKAYSHLRKSKNIAKANDYADLLGGINRSFGIINYYQKEHEIALEYFNRSLEALIKLGDEAEIDNTNYNIAAVSIELGDFDKAMEYLSKTYQYAQKTNDRAAIGFACYTYAKLYLRMEKFNTANKYAEQALDVADEIQSNYIKQSVFRILPIISSALGQYTNALNENERFVDLLKDAHALEIGELRNQYTYQVAEAIETTKSESEDLHRKNIEEEVVKFKILLLISSVLFIATIFFALSSANKSARLRMLTSEFSS